jgi:hypothetical protein
MPTKCERALAKAGSSANWRGKRQKSRQRDQKRREEQQARRNAVARRTQEDTNRPDRAGNSRTPPERRVADAALEVRSKSARAAAIECAFTAASEQPGRVSPYRSLLDQVGDAVLQLFTRARSAGRLIPLGRRP